MRKQTIAVAISALISLSSMPAFAGNEVVSQIIIQPKSFHLAHASSLNAGETSKLSQAAGLSVMHYRAMSGQAQVMRLSKPVTEEQAMSIIARLEASGEVNYAQIDRRVYPSIKPNDPQTQWGFSELLEGKPYLQNTYGVNLPSAWDITTGSEAIVVSVLDTGLVPHADIDLDLMDGKGKVAGGYDFIHNATAARDGDGRDANPTDQGDWLEASDTCGGAIKNPHFVASSWHGTHVAGIIGAINNNNLGVSSAGWSTRLLIARVLGKCGGWTSDVIDAARWSAGLSVPGVLNNSNPARILNMSLSGSGSCGLAEQAAYNDIVNAGGIIVVAAGNENVDIGVTASSPGTCQNVITVAATDRQGQRAFYSNYGKRIDISAPGGSLQVDKGILSTYNTGRTTPGSDDYQFAQGTSMATPHVSGIIALMLAVKPELKHSDVLAILKETATDFPAYTQNSQLNCTTTICGAGIVNAGKALNFIAPSAPEPPAPVPVPPPIPEPPAPVPVPPPIPEPPAPVPVPPPIPEPPEPVPVPPPIPEPPAPVPVPPPIPEPTPAPVPVPPPIPEPTPAPIPPPSRGGGSLGFLSLGALLMMSAYRRRHKD